MNLEAFSIGPIAIQPPLVMAPLHEITDQPFRRMIRQVGGVGLTVSEMISSEALIRHARKAQVMMAGEGEHPFSMQLSGSIPEHLAEAARMAEAAGADLVDLNMGCPASNVTSGGAGSALLKDLRLAECCVKAMVKAVRVPVTVKMRAGWDNSQKERADYLDFLRMFEAAGVQALAIHPRTRAQQYEGSADWALIARAVESGVGFPIIGNGDVNTPEDALRMFRETGCAGVMIGRAALTNPWIFQQILNPDLAVSEHQRIDLCMSFFRLLLELLEPREALHKMKKIGSWFTKGIPGGVSFRQNLHACNDPVLIFAALERLKADR
ncbi:MAG: tRNA dihydrouridine synthase DusB [Holophaga sp.]|nr:tRNA dihydrouridine synthase DusB [Holophaga sp.]